MSTLTRTTPRLTQVAVDPCSLAGEHYRAARLHGARATTFADHHELNLHRYPGKTIEHLTFTNIYLGGASAWSADDIQKIDWALPAALGDAHLNNVIAQYYPDGKPTTTFQPSRTLEGPLPHRVYKDTVEGFVAGLERSNALSGFDLTSSVFCFMLPRGILLSDATSTSHEKKSHADHDEKRRPEHDDPRHPEHGERPSENPALAERDADDSLHGLGGYHGSVHAKRGGKQTTVYYAVGVYSTGSNGIVAFDQPWKSICATFYHELCEARTDPDIDDAIRAGNDPAGDAFLGWYSPKGGEIGDIPMDEAGRNLGTVMKEVRLGSSKQLVPIQLMWSNAVGGPEGPITKKHKPAGTS